MRTKYPELETTLLEQNIKPFAHLVPMYSVSKTFVYTHARVVDVAL